MGREVAALALRRLLHAVPLLAVVSLAGFAIVQLMPGGPLEIYLSNPNVRPEDIERLRRSLGLDQPWPEQYARWLAGLVRGEWGYSFSDGRPVVERFAERLPATLELVLCSVLMAAAAALPAGVLSAWHRGGWLDRIVGGLAMAGVSLPVFWCGLVLQMVFAIGLGWLPSAGRSSLGGGDLLDRAQHLVLPASVLAFVQAAAWSRYLRSSMVGVLGEPYIAAGRARGVPARRLVWRHALRNAAMPALTVLLLDAAMLVSGAVVTESVFAWPGIGSLFTEALARRDYPVLMAFLMLTSAAVVALNFVADVCAVAVDPRTARPRA